MDSRDISVGLTNLRQIDCKTDESESNTLKAQAESLLQPWSIRFTLKPDTCHFYIGISMLPETLLSKRDHILSSTARTIRPSVQVHIRIPRQFDGSSTPPYPPGSVVHDYSSGECQSVLVPDRMTALLLQGKDGGLSMRISALAEVFGLKNRTGSVALAEKKPGFKFEPVVKTDKSEDDSQEEQQICKNLEDKLRARILADTRSNVLDSHYQSCDFTKAAALYDDLLRCASSAEQEELGGSWDLTEGQSCSVLTVWRSPTLGLRHRPGYNWVNQTRKHLVPSSGC